MYAIALLRDRIYILHIGDFFLIALTTAFAFIIAPFLPMLDGVVRDVAFHGVLSYFFVSFSLQRCFYTLFFYLRIFLNFTGVAPLFVLG